MVRTVSMTFIDRHPEPYIDERKSSSKPTSKYPDVSTHQKQEAGAGNVESETSEREKRFQHLNMCLPLYRAGLKGDWQATKAILKKYPQALRVPISEDEQNILHIATLAKRDTFVEEVLKLMRPDDLEMKDSDGNTALYCAALSGIVKIAKEMVKKNSKLPLIHGEGEFLPLHVATLLQNRDMVTYLFSATPFEDLTDADRILLLFQTISADLYDIALKILQKDQTLAFAEDSKGRIALEVLAKKTFAVGSRSQMSTSTWERSCYSC